ncbi:MAG: VOC family protein [Deltaproteobacteria bacterium]|nr:VOC family protein [Deltaproteobacteria bacterium]
MIPDHLILKVNDLAESSAFYTTILGWTAEGPQGPFRVLRVSAEFTVQLAAWGTKGGEHLAFAMDRKEFDEVFGRIRQAGIRFGDSFHTVGEMNGPGEEVGARGAGASLYFFDPNQHLLEIRFYEGAATAGLDRP